MNTKNQNTPVIQYNGDNIKDVLSFINVNCGIWNKHTKCMSTTINSRKTIIQPSQWVIKSKDSFIIVDDGMLSLN